MNGGEALVDAPAGARLASPCVGVCRLDADTGWCLGCGRSAEDLAMWRDADDAARERIWRELPARQARLDLRFRLLPWTAPALLGRLAAMSAEPGAAWTVGVYGAIAELMALPGRALSAEADAGGLTVRTRGGRLRLAAHPGLRAFALIGGSGRMTRIVLALHRSRLPPPLHAITELGADQEAVAAADRDAPLFDLGLGLAPVCFCVRTADRATLRALRAAAGRPLMPASPLLPLLGEASPDRVLASPLGRLEVTGPILRHDHQGPHTHLLPDLLAQRRELEPGFALPEGYAPCASFYPGRADAVSACSG